MYEIETEDVYKDSSSNKEMFDFSNYSIKSKYYNNLDKIVIVKVKDKTGHVAIEEFVGLKPFLVDKSNHKRAKGLNKNAVGTISHYEYKDVL